MRDILTTLEILTESTGLAGRKPGDTFRDPDGNQIVFKSIEFFPEAGGKYPKEQLDQALDRVTGEMEIQWTNTLSARVGGFAIATFSSDGEDIHFGKYFQEIKKNPTDNYFPNEVGNYTFAGRAAAKAQAGLTPQDLLTNKIDLTTEDILNQLSVSLGNEHPLYVVAQRIASGEKLPIHFNAPNDVSFSAFRDYFCEILQPIAIQNGNYTGNAGEAAEAFMDGSFDDTLISFDTSKTAGLSDSILTNSDGKIIKISTKGGAGAKASVRNLIDTVEEMKQTPTGKKLIRKHQDIIDIITEIKNQGQAGSPLWLAVKYDIINEKEAQQIRDLKGESPIALDEINDLSITSRLKKIALARKTDNPTNVDLYYHLIAAIAFKAADKVNDETNFPKAASDILNNGALVQVYTKAKEGKDTWTLQEFNTVYPGESIKGVYLSASKTYYSTGIKGNFTFKIDKGTGVDKDKNTDTDDIVTPKDKSSPSLSVAAKELTGKPASSSKSTREVGDVGREKRK